MAITADAAANETTQLNLTNDMQKCWIRYNMLA